MKASLVTLFVIAQVFLVLADQETNSKVTEIKKRENSEIGDVDLNLDEKSSETQRKRDAGYRYNKPSQFVPSRFIGFSRHPHRGRIVNKLQNQITRPFKQYGPPNQQTPAPNFGQSHPTSTDTIINQEVPNPLRDSSFANENPIATQNSQPFGQHSANYLPPRNQKLPSVTPPYQFSSQDDFSGNQQFEQQRFQEQNQQTDNQNFFGQNFHNQNFGQNDFQNQQISDAALFLTQNAEAISNLYGAPASDQNYAPHNQEFQPTNQNQLQDQQSQNLQLAINSQLSRYPNQLPSYASGVLDNQDTLEKIQSLEKDRIIAQLQQELSSRENAARFSQNENLAVAPLRYPSTHKPQQFGPGDVSFGQHGSSFLTSTTASSLGFQGYYAPSTLATTTTQAPVAVPTTPTTTTTTTLQPAGSVAGSSHVGTNLPPPHNYRPTIVNPGFPQYGGFVPTYVGSTGFLPSVPTFGTALYPTTALRPAETAPTHFAIPLPGLDVSKPAHPPTSVVPRPPHGHLHPSTPTFSIPLGPVHPPQAVTPVQPPIVKPHPIPVVPAATPVHPTYGIHPAVINPGFVYKPVKVYPVYYYPSVFHRKPVTTIAHPWNYAPSYTQAKIWK